MERNDIDYDRMYEEMDRVSSTSWIEKVKKERYDPWFLQDSYDEKKKEETIDGSNSVKGN